MSLIAWILLGLIAGFIARRAVTGSGAGLIANLLVGVVGAVVGGALFNLVGEVGVTGFNPWSVFVAVVGAALALVAYRAVAIRPAVPVKVRRGIGSWHSRSR